MSRYVLVSALVAGLYTIGCAHASPALYAGWEPMNAGIPKVASSADALRRLEQSRDAWRAWRPKSFEDPSGLGIKHVKGKYSYVRAQQIAKDRVEFTLFVVSAEDQVHPTRVDQHRSGGASRRALEASHVALVRVALGRAQR